MDATELRHDTRAKLRWIVYAAMAGAASTWGAVSIARVCMWWGQWQAGAAAGLLMLLAPAIYVFVLCTVQTSYVWSRTVVDGTGVTQTLFGHQARIDFSQPWAKGYRFCLGATDRLRLPKYEALELRQGGVVIRVLPSRLRGGVELARLPDALKGPFAEYQAARRRPAP